MTLHRTGDAYSFIDMKLAVVLALSAGSVLVPSIAAAASPPATAVATYTQVSAWPAGYVGNITVTNHTGVAINGWRVEFDLAAGTRITSSYSGVLSRTDDHYTMANASWNGTLAPGTSATFGWVAAGRAEPANCTLNGADCAGATVPPADHVAPTRPGPITFDMTGGVVLTWAPSTDDQGTVAYEVYESGRLLATVTGNRYVYSTSPALPPRIYVFFVRAVDPAGNPSISTYNTLGRIWNGDEVPPAPTGLQVTGAGPGLVRLSWTPVPSSSQLTIPPVAGYRVYLDGAPVGETGSASIILNAPSSGSHTYGVRSVNAVDQQSAPLELPSVAR
jgi:chitinase